MEEQLAAAGQGAGPSQGNGHRGQWSLGGRGAHSEPCLYTFWWYLWGWGMKITYGGGEVGTLAYCLDEYPTIFGNGETWTLHHLKSLLLQNILFHES